MDEICVGENPRGRGISFAIYSSILSDWLTARGVPYSTVIPINDDC
jgi:hypothetical protein